MKTLIVGLIAAVALTSFGAETNECNEASIKAFVERAGGQTLGAKYGIFSITPFPAKTKDGKFVTAGVMIGK